MPSTPLPDTDHPAAQHLREMVRPEQSAHVVSLTDEEIVALDGVDHPQVVVTPWLSAHDGDTSVITTVALRSLIVRGLVSVLDEGGDDPSADVAVDATPEITGVMLLRRTAVRVLVAHRTTPASESWWYGYIQDDGTVLEEDVDPSGQHQFSVCSTEHVVDRLRAFVDPRGDATGGAAERLVARDDLESVLRSAPFDQTAAVTTLTVLTPGSDVARVCSLYAHDEGVTVLSGVDASSIRIEDVGEGQLTATLGELVGHRGSPSD